MLGGEADGHSVVACEHELGDGITYKFGRIDFGAVLKCISGYLIKVAALHLQQPYTVGWLFKLTVTLSTNVLAFAFMNR